MVEIYDFLFEILNHLDNDRRAVQWQLFMGFFIHMIKYSIHLRYQQFKEPRKQNHPV